MRPLQFSLTLATEVLLRAGVKILQYRHKEPWTQAEYDEAVQISRLCREAGVLFVLNDRADYARLLGAALHLGQDDLPPLAARRVIGDEVIGFSAHDRIQLEWANEERVEYVSLGPIFSTSSKHNPDPTVGVLGLRELRALSTKSLVAIGGIKLENADDVLAAGADSVAVISGLVPGTCDRNAFRRRAEEWMARTRG